MTRTIIENMQEIRRKVKSVQYPEHELKDFVRAMYDSNPTKQKGIQFKPLFLRACFKTCYIRSLNRVEIGNIISKGVNHKQILEKLDTYNKANIEELERLFSEL